MEFCQFNAFGIWNFVNSTFIIWNLINSPLAVSILAMHLDWHIQTLITAWTLNCVNYPSCTYGVHPLMYIVPKFDPKMLESPF